MTPIIYQHSAPIASQTNYLSINLQPQPSFGSVLKQLRTQLQRPVARYQTQKTSTSNPGFVPYKRQNSALRRHNSSQITIQSPIAKTLIHQSSMPIQTLPFDTTSPQQERLAVLASLIDLQSKVLLQSPSLKSQASSSTAFTSSELNKASLAGTSTTGENSPI